MFDFVDNAYVWTLLLVAARVGGLFVVAPVVSRTAVPVRLRLFMSVAVAIAVVGRLGAPITAPSSLGGLALAVGAELMIGAAMGYAARLVFAGVEMGAVYVGQQMGVSLIEALNPLSDDESGTTRRLFEMLAIVIFLAIGGHRQLISALMGSFEIAPVGAGPSAASMLTMATALLAASFALALKVAAPVLVTLLLATVAMGLLQRSILPLNIFSIGFPIYAMLGLLTLAAAIAVLSPLIDSAWSMTIRELATWLKTG